MFASGDLADLLRQLPVPDDLAYEILGHLDDEWIALLHRIEGQVIGKVLPLLRCRRERVESEGEGNLVVRLKSELKESLA